ncbi:hypothetical protein D3C76_535950 [compost metagenome]
MSKTAGVFLFLALTSLLVAIALPLESGSVGDIMGTVGAVFALLFVLALVKGRRFKFNPVLR